jgi:hypothetical protein
VGAFLVGGILLAVGIGVLVALLMRGANQSAYNARFKDHIEEYLAIKEEQPTQGKYIKGKMVIIKVFVPDEGHSGLQKEVDEEVFEAIPAELRATGPEDVGTVVVLRWRSDVVGFYPGRNGGGASACVHTCDVRIIDRSLSAIIANEYFRGGSPPQEAFGNRHHVYGSKPVKEIADYLVKLPREPGATKLPPQNWTVLFRSDDPAVWNTESPGAKFAVPARRAHPAIRFLRLKRMDTGAMLIVPITYKQLTREDKSEPAKGYWWNGTARDGWGGRHLGLAQTPPALKGPKGPIGVANNGEATGSGFGHKLYVNDKQYYCWQGQEIPKTVFEIAVTAQPLTQEERRWLMK